MCSSVKPTLPVLNDDILDMISACTLEDALNTWPSNDHFTCAVRLSSVFRRLRTIIITRPVFWNRLFINLKVRGEAFDTILARSKQAQLYVFVLDPVCLQLVRPTLSAANHHAQWCSSALAFLNHCSRIRELEIHGQNGEQGELRLADVLGPLDLAQQIAARSHSLLRLALHDISGITLLCIAGPNVVELSLTGHMLVDRRVLERALVEMASLTRLTLDSVYFAPPLGSCNRVAAYNRGADLEYLRLGWTGRNHSLSNLREFCIFVMSCLPGALASAKEAHFDFRHSQAWTNAAIPLIELMKLDAGEGPSTLEIDGDANTYTFYSPQGRICVRSTPSLRDTTAGIFHRAVTSAAKHVTLTCNGGRLDLLDDTVLAPWERSGAINNATSLKLVLEVPESIDYTTLAVSLFRRIPMPKLREIHFWLSEEEDGGFYADSALKLVMAPVCVELLRCFDFPVEVQQVFSGPTFIADAIETVSDGEFYFSNTRQN